METKIFSSNEIETAAELLKQGELVAFPTETVYGLGADAMNETAVKKVYQVKGRPSDNPLIVHVDGVEMLKKYVDDLSEQAQELIKHFWPGALTLIFSVKEGTFSKTVTGGLKTVAFRTPDNQATITLIKKAGAPIVGPSANTSGKPSPTSADHVYHDLQGKIAGILNDGTTQIGVESTVLDLTSSDGIPVILRPGAVTKKDLEELLDEVKYDPHLASEKEQPKAPGMKYKHYAPNVPVWIIPDDDQHWQAAVKWATKENKKIGLYADDGRVNQLNEQIAASFSYGDKTVERATKELFAGLRSLDEEPIDLIFAPAFFEENLGVAYMNRLKKAANQKIFEI
ncbi:L-threonylcarbamoyladenylate synthase [Enterococcus sp. LJL99]